MKSKFFLYLLLVLWVETYSQDFHANFDTYNNLKRYSYYRERLKDFIWMENNPDHSPFNWSAEMQNGEFTHFGSYLPAKRYYVNQTTHDNEILDWGDTGEHMGAYLLALATEYRLMEDYGQPTNAILNELVNALYALERMDMFTEHSFRNEYYGCTPPVPLLTNDINGVFFRDDVHPDIKNKNSIWTHVNTITSNYIDYDNDDLSSQDMIWHILIGLSLVKKLVNEPYLNFTNLKGDSYTISEWAAKLGERLIGSMRSTVWDQTFIIPCWECGHGTVGINKWFIRNPVNCQIPKNCGSFDLIDYAKYFEKASVFFKGVEMTWGVTTPVPVFQGNEHFQACGKFSLATIAKWYPYDPPLTFSRLLDNLSWYITHSTETEYGDLEYGFEHLPLIFWLLHKDDETVQDYTPPDASIGFFERMVELLNSAPDCGPFNYGSYNQIVKHSDPDWASQTRLSKPHRTTQEGIEDEGNPGYYHGLDYMALHNLYWLVVIDKYISNKYTTTTMPFLPFGYGSDYDPAIIEASNKVIANSLIKPDGDVTLKGAHILLNRGFKVQAGGKLKTVIQGNISDATRFEKLTYTPDCSNWPPPATKSKIIPIEEFSENEEIQSIETQDLITTATKCELGNTSEVIIYPNPTNQILKIKNLPSNCGKVLIHVTSTTGEIRYSATCTNSNVTLDLHNLTDGFYILHMFSENNEVNMVKNIVIHK